MATFTCPLCDRGVISLKGLGHHFNRGHGITSEEIAHLVHAPTTCECGNIGRFLSITRGYSQWCAACETRARSEGAKRMHGRLKSDPTRYAQFRERTAEAVKREWQSDQTARIENISKAKKASSAAMSAEERKRKFG